MSNILLAVLIICIIIIVVLVSIIIKFNKDIDEVLDILQGSDKE